VAEEPADDADQLAGVASEHTVVNQIDDIIEQQHEEHEEHDGVCMNHFTSISVHGPEFYLGL